MHRRAAVCIALASILFAPASFADSFDLSVNLVISDQEVISIGRAQYNPDAMCLDCPHWGNHRINGGSASYSWRLYFMYERKLSDWVSDGGCYSGFLEAWGAAGAHDTLETIQKCAPCVLWTEADGSGSITGAPIGKSSYNCGANISLTAQPAAGWRFDRWGGSISSQAQTLSFTLDASKSLTAFFEREDTCSDTCWTTCDNGVCPPEEVIQECTPYCSPLVLDISADGIATSGADDPVLFDIDGDGDMELLGWLARAGDDAFLWRDVERNHRVDDGSELFGVGMTLPDGRRAANGFEALAAYDRLDNGGNGDGWITNADAVWPRLRLWMDRNHNGVSEPGELLPVQAAGVVSLNLTWSRSAYVDPAGNQFRMVGTYTLRDGQGRQEQMLADVFFRVFR